MPNRLADATSPYLLQHASNPVDWWSWGPEAFAEARVDKVSDSVAPAPAALGSDDVRVPIKGVRKMILIEECWKALASANMSNYIRYLFKTVRKFFGEAVVVTQEVEDIISSPIVKGTIINNSDCKILLDQRKYMNKFDEIQTLLGLTDKERAQILSINMANNPSRKYKEVWIGLGGSQSAVYATEVSLEEYMVRP